MTPTTVRRARFNHGATVTAFVASRDGRLRVTGGDDARVRVWDGETGDLKRTFREHKTSITCLALSACERFVVSGDERGQAAVSEIATGASVLRSIFGSAQGWPIHSVAISTAGAVAFGAGRFEQRHDLYGDRDEPPQVRGFASLDEVRALSPGPVEGARGRLLRALDDRSVRPSVRFTGDDLVIDSEEQARPSESFSGGTSAVVCVAFDGDAITSFHADGSILGRDPWRVKLPDDAFAFGLRNGTEPIAGTKAGALVAFDREAGDPRPFSEVHTDGIRALALTSDGRYAITGGIDGHLRVWDLEARGVIATSSGDPPEAIHGLEVLGDRVVAGDRSGGIAIWRLPRLELLGRFTRPTKTWWGFGAVALSETTFAQASFTDVVLRRPDDGAVTRRISASFAVNGLGFRPDGRLVIVTASADSQLRIGSGRELALDGRAAAFALRGARAVLGFTDGSVVAVDL